MGTAVDYPKKSKGILEINTDSRRDQRELQLPPLSLNTTISSVISHVAYTPPAVL